MYLHEQTDDGEAHNETGDDDLGPNGPVILTHIE